jgi:hypothetical protein
MAVSGCLGRRSEFISGGRHGEFATARSLRDHLFSPDEFHFVFDDLAPDPAAKYYGGYATISFTSAQKRILAIPPTFDTGPALLAKNGLSAFSNDLSTARHPQTDPRRFNYLVDRWKHWATLLASHQGPFTPHRSE